MKLLAELYEKFVGDYNPELVRDWIERLQAQDLTHMHLELGLVDVGRGFNKEPLPNTRNYIDYGESWINGFQKWVL